MCFRQMFFLDFQPYIRSCFFRLSASVREISVTMMMMMMMMMMVVVVVVVVVVVMMMMMMMMMMIKHLTHD